MSKREKFRPNAAYNLFLSRLRLARQEKQVSQRELARRLGDTHWSKVIRSENGDRAMTIIEVRAVCEALGISVVEFTRELEAALSALEAEGANPATADAPASDDNDAAASASMTPPSSLS